MLDIKDLKWNIAYIIIVILKISLVLKRYKSKNYALRIII